MEGNKTKMHEEEVCMMRKPDSPALMLYTRPLFLAEYNAFCWAKEHCSAPLLGPFYVQPLGDITKGDEDAFKYASKEPLFLVEQRDPPRSAREGHTEKGLVAT